MTRYVKQRNEYECAPVAVVNALKWLGHRSVTYRDVARIKKECRTNGDGTYSENMAPVIAKYIPRNRYVVCPTLLTLLEHLGRGRAFIFSYGYEVWDGEEWHCALCIGQNSGGFEIINGENAQTVSSHMDFNRMRKALEFKGCLGDRVEAWLV